ncbi:MAG TPA: NTP transferase domain-containing protein [Aquabacterium sp.]|uniref:nucleotidyltransferase family protein n=1 Tax=Aquabacterium sp. TaxID=1872578 RepID=UPI002E354789|nr:NTP transferase domain-containing protein [Aquabacterium sp.]HEX5357734.1 NTP transferase domain-containing protein [Aquabacterium sp.]
MNTRATVIILPPSVPDGAFLPAVSRDPVAAFGLLQTTLYRVLASQLPMVLVAPKAITDQARGLLPHNCLVDTTVEPATGLSSLARSVAAGVLASSQADGWLVLPGDMPMLSVDTIKLVSSAVQTYPIAYAQYRARRGHPMGFGKELFSELVHLDADRDLHRLTSRYPAEGIDVDDPGVIMHGSATIEDMIQPHTDAGTIALPQHT